jgi:type VI secretion system protein ImpB
MPDGIHKVLNRVRAPRVHISYEVETGGAVEMKELPFVMGVLGDFTGHPSKPLPKLKDRRFVEISPDNFDDVLESMRPRLSFEVANVLSGEPGSSKLSVDLTFESLADFSPERVAQQVEPLRELLKLRQRLANMRASLQGNDRLEEILQRTLKDEGMVDRLKTELETA